MPYFPSLPVDNVRTGFFERAEVEALLAQVNDAGIRDFIEWGFRTGMRKGEIGRLTWEMLDRTGTLWIRSIRPTTRGLAHSSWSDDRNGRARRLRG